MAARRKIKSNDKPPVPMVELVRGQLVPCTALDAELIEAHSQGSCFDLVSKARRSNPQNRLYWKILGNVVASGAGRWRQSVSLHRDLKLLTGYWEWEYDVLEKRLVRHPVRTAFEEMPQNEFNLYFEAAMASLAEMIGVDPMESLVE